jgi:type II secretion system protein D
MNIFKSLQTGMLCVIGLSLAALAQDPPPPVAPISPVPPMAPTSPAGRVITPRAPRPSAATNTAERGASGGKAMPALKFAEGTPIEIYLKTYVEVTGQTLLVAPDVNLKATPPPLNSNPQAKLTQAHYLEAIERLLNMNKIVLIPIDEVFLRVENSQTVMKRGFETGFGEVPEGGHIAKGQFVSQMVRLKYVSVDDAFKAIEGFKRDDGQITLFKDLQSILILDSAENVNRMLEIIAFIDIELPIRDKVFYRKIEWAKAADIQKKLNDFVAESQKQMQGKESIQTKTTGSPGMEVRRPVPILPPGVRRAGTTPVPKPPATPNEVIATALSDADRGMIRGRVNIVADERSTPLIIITSEENMKFFDDLIVILDVKTAPNFTVEVMRLEHADAEEIAKMVNDLIGNESQKDDAPKTPGAPAGDSKTLTLPEAVRQTRLARTEPATGEAGISTVGELNKDNIKVLPDKRINGIIIKASKADLDVIKTLIASMDIQLSQVLIETVVLEVSLGDDIEAGIDWVKHVNANAGAQGWLVGGAGDTAAFDLIKNTASNLVQSGIAYYTKINKLDLDLVIKAASTDTKTKVLASPVIQTMDNKEATIKATELVYLFNGKKAVTVSNNTTYEDDFVQKEIGITVTVTPRINAKGNVMMTVKQMFQDRGADQKVNASTYATTTTREINADVIVNSGQTIILGGLVKKSNTAGKSGIPFLSDIPYLGWLFGKQYSNETRSELLVFMTPHVFATQADASEEARRRREALGRSADGLWTQGWSKSPLAEPEPVEDVLRRERARVAREEAIKRSEAALQKLREKEANKKASKAPQGVPVTTNPGDAAKTEPAPAAPAVETAVPIETFPIEPLLAPVSSP